MMNQPNTAIPPPRASSRKHGGNFRSGRVAGISEALRALNIGESKQMPIAWENCLCAVAQRIGIKITSRRLGSTETVTVWRTE